jgi:hypothetical protein
LKPLETSLVSVGIDTHILCGSDAAISSMVEGSSRVPTHDTMLAYLLVNECAFQREIGVDENQNPERRKMGTIPSLIFISLLISQLCPRPKVGRGEPRTCVNAIKTAPQLRRMSMEARIQDSGSDVLVTGSLRKIIAALLILVFFKYCLLLSSKKIP